MLVSAQGQLASSQCVRDGCRRTSTLRRPFGKDFPQTYTMTKATHKGLLRAFDFRNINSGPEAEREGEV